MTGDVTVVVMTRNRRRPLAESLPRHEAPVVLVDNGSSDGTPEAARRSRPDARVVRLRRNAGAAARTIGARVARSRYVAFADDDSWWDAGMLRTAGELLDRHPGVGALCARILVGDEARLDPASAVMAASPLVADTPAAREVGPRILGFVACATVVRRDAFLSVGGFDDIVRFPGEEARVAIDLAAGGWGLHYAPELVVRHHPAPGGRDPAVRRRLVARSDLLTAVLRRPWPVVARAVRSARRSGHPERAGVRAAAPDLPRALAARRLAPPAIERELELLSGCRARR